MAVVSFHSDMIPQAADLLAVRHQRDRVAFPQLPAQFDGADACQQAIETAFNREHASGVAVLNGDRLEGYLIGDMTLSTMWGRSGWVRMAGFALRDENNPELLRQMYAVLGEQWVQWGCFMHAVNVPIHDSVLLQAWFSLCFGMEQVYASLDLSQHLREVVIPAGVTIRQGTPKDRDGLIAISDLIWRESLKPPCWGIMLPENVAGNEEGWAELLETDIVWLAEVDGQVVGSQAYYPSEPAGDTMFMASNSIHMTLAVTQPEYRGRGIATALTQYGLAQAREKGYQFCETDWRSTNLSANRAWTAQGFPPVMYRLTRRIDQRIMWARGDEFRA